MSEWLLFNTISVIVLLLGLHGGEQVNCQLDDDDEVRFVIDQHS